jgi:hypothetical protein
MTNEEINDLLATKLMGWTEGGLVTVYDGDPRTWKTGRDTPPPPTPRQPDDPLGIKWLKAYLQQNPFSTSMIPRAAWRPTTDARATLECIHKVIALGECVSVVGYERSDVFVGPWFSVSVTKNSEAYTAVSADWSLAICAAILRSLGYEVL